MLGNKTKKKPGDVEDIKEFEEQRSSENVQEEIPEEIVEETPITKEEEYLNNWKRCQADFENFKKRQSELNIENLKYANRGLIMDIIPVLDNFHASTDHIPEDQKDNAWVTGIMYIQKQLEKVLSDNGVSEIETKVGDKFNPELHEAVQNSEQEAVNSEQLSHKIKKVVIKGYKLNGRVIRASRVIVE